jgi:hypothetical protein
MTTTKYKVGDKLRHIGPGYENRTSFGTIYQIIRIENSHNRNPKYWIICDDGNQRYTYANEYDYELVTDEVIGNKNDVDFLELLKGY